MPTVKIELAKGQQKTDLFKIRDIVMDTVVETLQLPDNDRNIRIMEYEPDLFVLKPPYKILIEIALFKGRTPETKKHLYKNLVINLEKNTLFGKENILIFLNEQPLENWAGRGGVSADDMNLEFKVNV